MQKKIKTFLIFLGTLLLCFVISSLGEKDAKADEVTTPKSENTLPTTDTNTVVKPPIKDRTTVYLPLYNQNKEEVMDDLTFELKGNNEVITAKNDEGEIGAKLKNNASYTITLLENDKYTLKPFSFTVKNGSPIRDDNNELIYNLDLEKKTKAAVEKPKSRTTLYLSVLEGKEESEADLTFEFKHGDETIVSKNDVGQVGAKLLNDTSYLVKLQNNDKYDFKEFSFTLKNGTPYRDDNKELLVSLDIIKKATNSTPLPEAPKPDTPKPETNKPDKDPNDCGCETPKQDKVTIKQLKVVDIKDPEGDTIKEPLTFVFFNVSKQKPAGEYTSTDGKLPKVEMLVDDEYEVYLKTNDKYGMRHRHFYAFMNHYPIDMEDEHERYTDRLEVIKKDKDYVEPKQPAVTARMQVRYKGKLLKEPVTFEFVSNGETLKATSKDGLVSVDLHENTDYMVGVVNNDKYDIETFPVVIKNKQVGKFPYDHRTCWLVEHLDLLDKGTISTTNPHYTIATKDEKVRISGMDFKDLNLDVKTIDPTTIPALKGMDALVYDISFINIYRHEIVNLKGDFTVTVPKDRNKKVKAIYYINDFGKLEKQDAIPGEFNSVITFKTTHFSRYALVYGEDKETTVKPNEDSNKPVAPTVKPNDDSNKPVAPSVKPNDDSNKPVAPAVKPNDDSNKPVVPSVKPLGDSTKPVSMNVQDAPRLEVPAYGNAEIKKIITQMEQIINKIKDGEKNGAKAEDIKVLKERLANLQEAFDTLSQNLPAINKVPEFDLTKLSIPDKNQQVDTIDENFNQTNSVTRDEANSDGKISNSSNSKTTTKPDIKTKEVLPNTGMNSTSSAAIGLGLISLIGLAIRRKLAK